MIRKQSKQFITFLLIFLSIRIYAHGCKEGCLKCNSLQQCEICNFWQFYFLNSSGECELIDDGTCSLPGQDQVCLMCLSNYHLDLNTYKCVKVQQKRLVPNCYFYDQHSLCILCYEGYYLYLSKCYIVTQVVQNCQLYLTNGLCYVCHAGYYKDMYGTSCTNSQYMLQDFFGCQRSSIINCDKCVDGFIFQPDNYNLIYDSLDQIANQNFVVNSMLRVNQYGQEFYTNKSCQKILVNNCSQLKSFSYCSVCNEGYYQNLSGECIKNPYDPILNCLEYSSKNSCIQCQEGYFLKSNTCLQVVKIENCKKYDGRVSLTQCMECNDEYYLDNSICKKRNNQLITISQCINLAKNKDLCEECQNNYILSTDGLKCYQAIDNCQIYSDSAINQQITCILCLSGYYLDNDKSCIVGNIDNCDEYTYATTCSKCSNGFYLFENQCHEHNQISNCISYDQTIQNRCLQCSSQYFLINIIDYCIEYNEIEFCKSYDQDSYVCIECMDYYYLTDNKCKKIEIQHCLNSNDGIYCEVCEDNFFQYKNNCLSYPTHLQQNCLTVSHDKNLQEFHDMKCEVCQKDYIPFPFKNEYYCYDKNLLQFSEIEIIENCKQYKNSICIACEDGYYLYKDFQNNYQCVLQCSNFTTNGLSMKHQIIQKENSNEFEIQKQNVCILDDEYIEGCSYMSQDLSTKDLRLICLKCKADYFQVISLTNNSYSLQNPNRNGRIQRRITMYPQVLCISEQNQIKIYSVNNCMFYQILSFGYYSCIRCKDGYVGQINQNGIVESCNLMTTDYANKCRESQQRGFTLFQTKILSCNFCFDYYKVNFIPMYTKSLNNPMPVRLGQFGLISLNWGSINIYNLTQNCFKPNPQQLGYDKSNQIKYQLPNMCSSAILNLTYKDGNALGNMDVTSENNFAIYCIKCQMNYYAIYHQKFPFIITQCIKIENCLDKLSDWSSACQNCKIGHIFGFDSINEQINHQYCQKNNVQWCYASDSESLCSVCKKGYSLTYEKQCAPLKPSLCKQFQYYQKYIALNQLNQHWKLYFMQDGIGCRQCNDNFISIYNSSSENYCFFSNFLFYNQIDREKMISNCLYYFQDRNENDDLLCYQCQQNHSISIDNKYCYKNLPNCLIAQNQNICNKCYINYGLSNGKCIEGNIRYCLIYNSDEDKSELTCIQCQPEYYLNSTTNICIKSNVNYCLIGKNDNQNGCEQCFQGYMLIEDTSQDHCMKIPSNYECKINEIQFLNDELQISCLQCINNNFVKFYNDSSKNSDNDSIKSLCVQYPTIDHCVSYQIKQNNSHKIEIKCVECNSNYYTKYSVCEERTKLDKNCEAYKLDSEECQQCISSYFYSIDDEICFAYSQGVSNCYSYQNETTCLQCKQNYYLFENFCFYINITKQINGCLFYKNILECQQCQTGYMLKDSTCLLSNLTNCLSYTSLNHCQKCKDGYGLVISDLLSFCEKYPDQNCILYETFRYDGSEDFKCITCDIGYIQNEVQQCIVNKSPIQNCLYQKTSTICNQCLQGYVLSLDKTRCFSDYFYSQQLDKNCLSSIETKMYCSQCIPTYYTTLSEDKKSIQCTKCVSPATFEDGCYVCTKELNVCSVCFDGYYMNTDYTCVKYQKPLRTGQKSLIKRNIKSLLDINRILVFILVIIFNQLFQFQFLK